MFPHPVAAPVEAVSFSSVAGSLGYMTPTHHAELVQRARKGDSEAFADIVEAFRAMAVGYAFARLRDHGLAEDVTQEAFTDAFLHLAQLRDAAAFPGWFRRVLLKHCDRQTRRSRPDVIACDREPSDPAPPEHSERLDSQRQALWLRDTIEALPEHERVVVALHYLGDCPQADVARFLELPLTTVKKRLHVARKRLDQWRHSPPTPSAQQASPDNARIRLFLAIRAGDQRMVGRILTRAPDLVQVDETWSDEEALASGLPLAHGQPPLVLAAARRDVAMVDFLLSWGAPLEGRCHCSGAETALWAAVRAGDLGTTTLLLQRGADIGARNAAGLTALHVAALRGRADLVTLLLRHGAKTDARDDGEPLPVDWARARGHTEVLALLDAQTGNAPRSDHTTASCQIETGIKALDLWVPLSPGAIIRVHAAADTGLMVLMSEIVRRFADRGGASVWASWERQPWHTEELDTVAAEAGVESCLHLVKATCTDSAEQRHSVVERALAVVADLAHDHDPVALFVFEEPGHRAQIEAALPRLAQHAHVVFVIEPWAEVTRGEISTSALHALYSGVLCTDPGLARRGLYPAIDPKRSRVITADDAFEPETTRRARVALASDDEDPASTAALRKNLLEAFLTEPFVVAEQMTGWPAQAVAPAEVAATVRRLLAGEYDSIPPDALRYLSTIPDDVGARAVGQFRQLR